MLLANHGALTVGADLFSAYYKMETIEHFAKISLVARLLGRENLIAREEVDAAAGAARHLRHQGAGADLRRPTPLGAVAWRDAAALCQVVEAPAGGGLRLVPERRGVMPLRMRPRTDDDAEIRLTYRELSALIEDAIRSLK